MRLFFIIIVFFMIPIVSIILLYDSKEDKQHKIWISVLITVLTDIFYLAFFGLLNYTQFGTYYVDFKFILCHIVCATVAVLTINFIRKRNKKRSDSIVAKEVKIKKKHIVIISIIFIFLIGFIPDKIHYLDGGTVEYSALFYKVIIWHSICRNDIHDSESQYHTGTDIYIFPFNFGEKG